MKRRKNIHMRKDIGIIVGEPESVVDRIMVIPWGGKVRHMSGEELSELCINGEQEIIELTDSDLQDILTMLTDPAMIRRGRVRVPAEPM